MTDITSGWTEAELLQALAPSVKAGLQQVEAAGADWNAAGLLLAATPLAGVALKGGTWRHDLWDAVKREFHSFACTSSKEYADLRKQWKSLKEKGSHFALASLSGVIGAHLGVASGIVAPLVIWLAVVALRVGLKALCATLGAPPTAPAAPAS